MLRERRDAVAKAGQMVLPDIIDPLYAGDKTEKPDTGSSLRVRLLSEAFGNGHTPKDTRDIGTIGNLLMAAGHCLRLRLLRAKSIDRQWLLDFGNPGGEVGFWIVHRGRLQECVRFRR